MARGVWKNGLKPTPPNRKGCKLSQEHINALSKANLGNKYNLGKTLSQGTREKISKNNARYWLGKIGKEHPHWKDFKITPLYQQIRTCFSYRQWRWDVYTRDNFTCVLCGRKKEVSGRLEADHYPKQFAQIFLEYEIKTYDEAIACEELWNINNGRTLCKECHDPTRGRRPKKQQALDKDK